MEVLTRGDSGVAHSPAVTAGLLTSNDWGSAHERCVGKCSPAVTAEVRTNIAPSNTVAHTYQPPSHPLTRASRARAQPPAPAPHLQPPAPAPHMQAPGPAPHMQAPALHPPQHMPGYTQLNDKLQCSRAHTGQHTRVAKITHTHTHLPTHPHLQDDELPCGGRPARGSVQVGVGEPTGGRGRGDSTKRTQVVRVRRDDVRVRQPAVQYSTVRYSKLQYSTVRYGMVQYGSARRGAVQCSAVQCSAVQDTTVHYSAVSAVKFDVLMLC